jgi:hypothetical protein
MIFTLFTILPFSFNFVSLSNAFLLFSIFLHQFTERIKMKKISQRASIQHLVRLKRERGKNMKLSEILRSRLSVVDLDHVQGAKFIFQERIRN